MMATMHPFNRSERIKFFNPSWPCWSLRPSTCTGTGWGGGARGSASSGSSASWTGRGSPPAQVNTTASSPTTRDGWTGFNQMNYLRILIMLKRLLFDVEKKVLPNNSPCFESFTDYRHRFNALYKQQDAILMSIVNFKSAWPIVTFDGTEKLY